MPWIENCPRIAVELGTHTLDSKTSILIQITDADLDFVTPYHGDYINVFRFMFHDVTEMIEHKGKKYYPITQEQANQLVEILDISLKEKYNVIVHCTAGLCRSGAVTEVGSIMGFRPVHDNRLPNVEVKSKMLRSLYNV